MNNKLFNKKTKHNQNSTHCGFHCIKMQEINVSFGESVILEDVNIHIHCGNLTTLIGRNGAGKSTLIKAILGEVPHKGELFFQDTRFSKVLDMKIGYVPQNINVEKNTPTSVYDLFASYITNKPVFLYKDKKIYEKIKKSLAVFEAQDLIDKSLSDLSGGELQRVLLSIAITPVPNLLLLDEPISGMDKNGMELFYSNINYLKENYDLAIIMISHDFEYVKKYADNVILLDRTIVKEGSPEEVFKSEEFKKEFGNIY